MSLVALALGAGLIVAAGALYLTRFGRPVRQAEGIARRDLVAGGALLGGAAFMTLGGLARSPGFGLAAQAASDRGTPAQRALLAADAWLNTAPLSLQDLRGKVVLVNFWTYTCINSLRPLPYLRAWSEAFRDQGLVVIGVHTPEFVFEKDLANVRRAVEAQGIGYPVVLDSDYRIWRAFNNQAWPGFYFVDAEGRVRDRVLGEGQYEACEKLIRKLLSEAGAAGADRPIDAVSGQGAQAAPDWSQLGTPETYIGYAQTRDFASPGGMVRDAAADYRLARALHLNSWALSGGWRVGAEFASLTGRTGRVAIRFHARDLHMVLAPPASGGEVRFRITIDGAPPGGDHGGDADAAGEGRVREPRMYQLVRQAGPVSDRTFEIEFLDPGVRAYVFTFG